MLNKSFYKSVIIIAVLIGIIFHGQFLIQEVKNAMFICYNNVIPSLFIFMVFSSYIGRSEMADLLYLPFYGFSKIMNIQDKSYSSYLLLAMTGGFAVGADFLKKLRDKGYTDECICTVAPSMINNSLSFCVMAVGIGMLKNMQIGLMLFCSTSLAGIITSFILSFFFEYNIVLQQSNNKSIKHDIFIDSVTKSVKNILSICGFVIVFHCICEVLSLYIINANFQTFLCALSEVTCGCLKTTENFGKNPYLLCVVLSLLPVSTLCQIKYFTGNNNVVKTLLISRIIHTPVSYILFSVFMQLFPTAVYTSASDAILIKSYQNSFEISSTLFFITLAFIIISDRSRLFNRGRIPDIYDNLK